MIDPGNGELEDHGLITDYDIFAMLDQTAILDKIPYNIVDIRFLMDSVGQNISTEKQIILKEVKQDG